MVGATGLIKVVMLVGLFTGEHLDARHQEVTTQEICEAVQEYASEYNARFRWFWQDEPREVRVVCLEHPNDLEA